MKDPQVPSIFWRKDHTAHIKRRTKETMWIRQRAKGLMAE